ncbi:hypothetical protein ACU8V7_27835 [Zobellia nedashkovskayae]
MKNFIQKNSKLAVVFTATALTLLGSCSDDYLEEVTFGEVPPSELTTADNVEKVDDICL